MKSSNQPIKLKTFFFNNREKQTTEDETMNKKKGRESVCEKEKEIQRGREREEEF